MTTDDETLARIRACWDNDGVMHICGDPERCEELDTRPPASTGWRRPKLRIVRDQP